MTTLGLTILFAVIVAFGALVGLCRGLNKSVIRLMTLVLAVLLTFLVAAPVTRAIAENVKIEGLTLGEMVLESIAGDAMIAGILNAAPLMKEAILVAPAFAMGIVVLPVVFLLLRFVTWIVFLCVQKPLRKVIFKDNCNNRQYSTCKKGYQVKHAENMLFWHLYISAVQNRGQRTVGKNNAQRREDKNRRKNCKKQ